MADSTIRTPWPRAWTWALVLGPLLVGAQATLRWWGAALGRRLVGDIPTPADALPLVWTLLVSWILCSLLGGWMVGVLIAEGSHAREQWRWRQEQAARARQWAIREPLRELEPQIREEQMSEEERAWHRQYRERQAEITREARRRLGLPEDAPSAADPR